MKLEPAAQMMMIMRSAPRALTLAVAVGALALAGCGSSSTTTSGSSSSSSSSQSTSTPNSAAPAPSGSSAQILNLAADPEGALKFTTTSLSAKAGRVTIAFTNNAKVSHNVTIADASGAQVGATPTFEGGARSLSLSVKAGTYKFYCTIPGHRAAGMEGTLTVR